MGTTDTVTLRWRKLGEEAAGRDPELICPGPAHDELYVPSVRPLKSISLYHHPSSYQMVSSREANWKWVPTGLQCLISIVTGRRGDQLIIKLFNKDQSII